MHICTVILKMLGDILRKTLKLIQIEQYKITRKWKITCLFLQIKK